MSTKGNKARTPRFSTESKWEAAAAGVFLVGAVLSGIAAVEAHSDTNEAKSAADSFRAHEVPGYTSDTELGLQHKVNLEHNREIDLIGLAAQLAVVAAGAAGIASMNREPVRTRPARRTSIDGPKL